MTNEKNRHWLAFYKPNPQADIRLFCFPYAGGNAMAYRKWPDLLPRNIEVCPIELPGRGARLREAPFTQLVPMVQAIAEAMLPLIKNKPYALFGHSMGTLISFELARHFRKTGAPGPVHIFASGHTAPHVEYGHPVIYNLPDAEFKKELHKLNGTPAAVLDNEELMQLLMPVLRADFEVNETYSYEPDQPLDCPISVFGGVEDKDVTRESLEAWQEHTTASFSLKMFPGDHFFFQNVELNILELISNQLKNYVPVSY